MNIQVISDIHLEFGGFKLPDKDCDLLIAAGDIGVGVEGINWLKKLNIPVIYIAGNHEFWGFEIFALNEILTELSQGTNVHYLDNDSVVVEGVKFIGCTLWADFYAGDDHSQIKELESTMNDFRYIFVDDKPITSEQLVEINHESKKWLKRELNKPHDGPIVVVTHHAPSVESWSSYHEDYLKYAYCNDLDSMLKDNQIDLWVHGHIHRANDYIKHGVRVLCNPRGYKGYQLVKEFDPKKMVQV